MLLHTIRDRGALTIGREIEVSQHVCVRRFHLASVVPINCETEASPLTGLDARRVFVNSA